LGTALVLFLGACATTTTETTTTTTPTETPADVTTTNPASPAVRTTTSLTPEQRERLRRETKRDNFAWEITREAIGAFGQTNDIPIFDGLWSKTATPEQWVELKRIIERDAKKVDPRSVAVSKACRQAEPAGFSYAFKMAAREAETPSELFGGIFNWMTSGGKALFQGQDDKAYHFVCGALCELIARNGVDMAIRKEVHDRDHGSGIFDLDDLTATAYGALWIQEARRNPEWLKSWADGAHSLSETIRPFRYGQNKPFDDIKKDEILSRIRQDYGTPEPPPPTEPRVVRKYN